MRLMIDTMECAQGAFLASDVLWTERHALNGGIIYRQLGAALTNLAAATDQLMTLTRSVGADPFPSSPPSTDDVLAVLAAGGQS